MDHTTSAQEPRFRVLLADDDSDVCALVSRVLRPIAVVVAVGDAEAALATLYGGEQFDAIIADYMLPGMTGLELVERVRGRAIVTPLLMISGHERVEPRLPQMALGAGADAFLGKPFSVVALRATVRELLSARARVA